MTQRQWIVTLALLSLVLAAAAFMLDDTVRAWVLQIRPNPWKNSPEQRIMGAISRYGDWPWLMLMGTVGLVISWRLRRRDWTRILIAAMLASTLSGIIANASRLTTGRVRPESEKKHGAGWYGPWHTEEGRILIGDPDFNSFPSGHTATAFGFAAVFAYARPVWGVPFLLAAALITWSRVYLGRHHFSDVTVSILLSLFVAWFIWRWVETHGDKVFTSLLSRLRRK